MLRNFGTVPPAVTNLMSKCAGNSKENCHKVSRRELRALPSNHAICRGGGGHHAPPPPSLIRVKSYLHCLGQQDVCLKYDWSIGPLCCASGGRCHPPSCWCWRPEQQTLSGWTWGLWLAPSAPPLPPAPAAAAGSRSWGCPLQSHLDAQMKKEEKKSGNKMKTEELGIQRNAQLNLMTNVTKI